MLPFLPANVAAGLGAGRKSFVSFTALQFEVTRAFEICVLGGLSFKSTDIRFLAFMIMNSENYRN